MQSPALAPSRGADIAMSCGSLAHTTCPSFCMRVPAPSAPPRPSPATQATAPTPPGPDPYPHRRRHSARAPPCASVPPHGLVVTVPEPLPSAAALPDEPPLRSELIDLTRAVQRCRTWQQLR